MDNSSVLVP